MSAPELPFCERDGTTLVDGRCPSCDLGTDADAISVHEHVNATGWMRTFTGRKVTPMYLTPEQVCLGDIAHALARLCRYGGHCAGFMSVGEHSIEVAKLVRREQPEFELEALLHDAAEAYLGDLVRPLKKHPDFFAVYSAAEERAERAIAEVFELTYPWPEVIKEMDNKRLQWEMEHIRDDFRHTEHPFGVESRFHSYYQEASSRRKTWIQS